MNNSASKGTNTSTLPVLPLSLVSLNATELNSDPTVDLPSENNCDSVSDLNLTGTNKQEATPSTDYKTLIMQSSDVVPEPDELKQDQVLLSDLNSTFPPSGVNQLDKTEQDTSSPPHLPADATDETCTDADVTMMTSRTQGIVKNLCALSGAVLWKYFPGMDYLDVAKLFEKHTQSKRFQPTKLSVLCYAKLELTYSITTINNGLNALKECQTKSALPNVVNEQKLDKYLEALALKRKVSVTIPRLDPEVIQLMIKTHWTNIDPYSDIENIINESEKETDATSDPSSEMDNSGVFFTHAGGHVLRKRTRHYSAN